MLALTIDYHQRHRVELEAARTIAAQLADRHIILPLDLSAFGGSALTDDIDVPQGRGRGGHSGDLRPGAQHRLPQPRAGLGRGGGRARPVRRGQCARLFGLSRLPPRFHRRVRGARQPGDQGRGRGRRRSPIHAPLQAHDQGRHRARGGAARARRGDQPQLLRPGERRRRVRPVRRLPPARQGVRGGRAARPDALRGRR